MFSSQAAEVSLNLPCRTLASVRADKAESRFVIGSCSLQQPNYLHLVRFHSEVNELGVDARLTHADGPLRALNCSPSDPSLLLTAAERSSSASLYRMPRSAVTKNDSLEDDPDLVDDTMEVSYYGEMEKIATLLPTGGGAAAAVAASSIVDIAWRDTSNSGDDYDAAGSTMWSSATRPGDVLTIDQQGCVAQWDLSVAGDTTTEPIRSVNPPSTTTTTATRTAALLPRVAWDPHGNGDAVAVTRGTRVSVLDWRSADHPSVSIPTGTVDTFQAHRYGVTDLDYNPNKPYVMATAGQDGLVKFWDLRSARQPLLVARGGHSHWVWRVQYNPYHDQLVLSSGSDSVSNLWRLSTISSAPLLTLDDGEGTIDAKCPNVCVERHEHTEAVYAVSWSSADAWIYVALGYDGKAVLMHVPSNEKYKILL